MLPVTNAGAIPFQYRLLRVVEAIPNDDQQPIRLQRWADELWRKRIKQPVFPLSRGNQHYFVIPAQADLGATNLTFEDVPNRTYHLEPTTEIFSVQNLGQNAVERAFVARSVERALSSNIMSGRPTLWRDSFTRYFPIEPVNLGNARDRVNAFRGFHFSVVNADPAKLYIAVDPVTRYVGRSSLASYKLAGRLVELAGHCDVPLYRRLSLLRDNGTTRFSCYFAGWVGQPISDVMISELNISVYEYYQKRYPHLKVRAEDEAVYVVGSKNDSNSLVVPASRLFPIFTTESDEVRFCSVKPTMAPHERVSAISSFRQYFLGTLVNDVELDIGAQLDGGEPSCFLAPALEYGKGTLPGAQVPTGQKYGEWNRGKTSMLYSGGFFHAEPVTAMWLLHPVTLSRESRAILIEKLAGELRRLGLATPPIRQVSYTPDEKGRDLLRRTQEILGTSRSGLVLCVLSDQFKSHVHGDFKKATGSLFSQCLQEHKVQSICSSASKLRNLALAAATAAGCKPWVLADDLSTDLVIGIDVLQGRVVFNYLFGKGGREVTQQTAITLKEAIRKRILCEELVRTIGSLYRDGYQFSSITIHRDGRAWPGEIEAINQAMDELVSQGQLPQDLRLVVAELRKSHAPIRIFHFDVSSERWKNPFPGCYRVLTAETGLVNTTGRPVEWDGQRRTASTLFVNVVLARGAADVRAVLEDVYKLTQLNWSAPDIDINLPVTIRWADDALREEFIPTDLDD